jgi:aminopeptidase N
MKRWLIIFLLFFSSAIFAQPDVDVLHYRFYISLNDNNDTIHGLALINFQLNGKTSSVNFDLAEIGKTGKGMLITDLESNDPKLLKPSFTQKGDKLIIKGNDFVKGDKTTFILHYKGIPSDGLIISKNKYGHRTFFGDNWPNRAHNWIPCHDDPADKASVEFIISAPDHYQVVANGIKIEERTTGKGFKETYWKEDVPISPKVMTIGVADFAASIVGNLNDCIPIYSWTYPEDSKKGIYDFAVTKDILQYYSKAIGPYAFKKLANVQSKTRFGGLENANTIFYKEDAVTGDRRNETLYAHEIAHQWFGNSATEKSFAHLWLSEGFATYMTICYFENKYGKDSASKMRAEDRQQVIAFSKTDNTPVVNETETNYMQLLNENNYQKGGWVLHMLRIQLGDSIFWKAIRKYYADYSGSIAGTEDLQKVFEAVSGKNMQSFFKQWLYTPGLPQLDIKWKYDTKKKAVEITVRQLQSPPFFFPLELNYTKDNRIVLKKVLNVSAANETFSIPLVQKPVSLSFDPGINLLFSGTISELK